MKLTAIQIASYVFCKNIASDSQWMIVSNFYMPNDFGFWSYLILEVNFWKTFSFLKNSFSILHTYLFEYVTPNSVPYAESSKDDSSFVRLARDESYVGPNDPYGP